MPALTRLAQVRSRLLPLRTSLLDHPLNSCLTNVDALRLFMQHHVFAVWDFMSLLKALQRRLCSVDIPWIPPTNRRGCRLVNEIVLGEESDIDGQGGYGSHFDLYRRAMRQCGSSTDCVDRFLQELGRGSAVERALDLVDAPVIVRQFIGHTFSIIEGGDICAIAAAFAFGREDLLPDVFRQIVDRLNIEMGGGLEDFRFYLTRHVQVDGNEHGPMAGQLVEALCGSDARKWQAAEDAAVKSLLARKVLWDGVFNLISRPSP